VKKLGLIGGTGPESTIIYYRELEAKVCEARGGAYFPPMTIESLSVYRVLGYCREQDLDGLAEYLLAGIRNLAAAGADAAAFTGITPHIVYDRVAEKSPIPIVSMVQTSCDYLRDRGYTRAALLGTIPTMNVPFFRDALGASGVTALVPTASEQQFIGEKIERELESGIVKPETVDGMASIARRLVDEEGAQAVILGCTELPLAFDQVELGVPTVDVMRVHIDRLAELVLEG
jgi:aspartate racemase